jgi:hypothetical protein
MEHELAVRNLAVECYLLGEMTPGEREAFEEHYFECAICGEDVRAASRFLADMKGVFEAGAAARTAGREAREPRSTLGSWPAWLQPQLAAAAFVLLAAVAGVETLSTIPGLRREVAEANAPRIVKSQVLRPQTRGAATVLDAPAGGPVVLSFDLPEFSPLLAARGLQFVVRSTDGRVVFEVTGRSLEPGDPVTLSVPRLDLPAGNYTLLVETVPETGKGSQELGQYPFAINRQ